MPTINYFWWSKRLKHAQADYETLYQHVERQIEGLKLAKAFLTIK